MEKETTNTGISYRENGKILAKVTYSIRNGVLVIMTTVVDPSLRGQGIAGRLMDDVEAYCQENNLKIRATCSYALKYFSKGEHPLFQMGPSKD